MSALDYSNVLQQTQADQGFICCAGKVEASTSAGFSSIDAAMAELDMEHYDDENEEVPGLFGTGKHPGMAYYSRAEDDPYLAKASDSEDEEVNLKKSDFLILAARNEDDVSHLEASGNAGSSSACVSVVTNMPLMLMNTTN